MSIQPLVINIEEETLKNDFYRQVIFTSNYQQLVLMSLLPEEDIPMEIHHGDQFIRVEQGEGIVILNGVQYDIFDGVSINIPAGVHHYVKNTGTDKLKLYSLYSPREHPEDCIEYTDPQTRERTKC